MKRLYLSLIFLLLLFSFITCAWGTECSTAIAEDCTITSSFTFPSPTIYRLDDNNTNGAIIINANNIVVDFNGSTILGNYNYTSGVNRNGIKNSKSNVTLKNVTVGGYRIAVYFSGNINTSYLQNATINDSTWGIYVGNNGNSSISNTLIYNSTRTIQVYNVRRGGNTTFINNVVYGNGGIQIINNSNVNLSNNIISNITNRATPIWFEVDGNTNFINNTVDNCNASMVYIDHNDNATISGNILKNSNYTNVVSYLLDVNGDQGMNYIISNNTLLNSPRGLELRGEANFTVNGNYFNYFDVAINGYGVSNVTLINNNITNITRNDDGYNIGIYFQSNSNNITLQNNSITDYGHIGVWIQQSSNILINSTTCNQLSLGNIVNGAIRNVRRSALYGWGWYHYYEPTACIYLGEQYEGWLGDSTESKSDGNSKFKTYNVTNINVQNIITDSNVQTYLHLQGVYGSQVLSLPSYWYVKFQTPTNMTDADEFYNNLAWSNLSIVPSNVSGISTILKKNRAGMSNFAFDEINYTMFQVNRTFKNINDVSTHGLNISNLSLAYPFNDIYNLSSGLVLASNVDTWSGNVEPNGEIRVGDYTAPIITVTSPLSRKYGQLVNIIFNATDGSNVSTLWYYNGTAYRLYTGIEARPYPVGTHTFIFYANDSFNNTASTSSTFRVVEDIKAQESCDNIFDVISDAFGLVTVIFIVLVAATIITLVQGIGMNIDIKGMVVILIVSSIMTLIGYAILAKISGALC